MSMYIMKPWYKNRSTRQTTTFSTSSSTVQFLLQNDSPSENFEFVNYFTNKYPNISISTKSTTNSNTSTSSWLTRTYSSVTYTYPLILYSQLETDKIGDRNNIYNKFSTNRTMIDLKSSDVTCSSTHSQSTYVRNSSYRQVYSAYLSSLTYQNNTVNQPMIFSVYKTMTGNNAWITTDVLYSDVSTSPLVPRLGTSISTYPQLMFNSKSMSHSYSNNTKQTYRVLAAGFGAVVFEISDPYKVTVKLDEAMTGGIVYSYSSAPNTTYSTGSVTLYRATLTEVPD